MINDNKETKICKRCGRELPLDKFGINNGYIRSFCKDCNNKYHRGYRHAKRMQAIQKNNIIFSFLIPPT